MFLSLSYKDYFVAELGQISFPSYSFQVSIVCDYLAYMHTKAHLPNIIRPDLSMFECAWCL
jgi:hypothetical protein